MRKNFLIVFLFLASITFSQSTFHQLYDAPAPASSNGYNYVAYNNGRLYYAFVTGNALYFQKNDKLGNPIFTTSTTIAPGTILSKLIAKGPNMVIIARTPEIMVRMVDTTSGAIIFNNEFSTGFTSTSVTDALVASNGDIVMVGDFLLSGAIYNPFVLRVNGSNGNKVFFYQCSVTGNSHGFSSLIEFNNKIFILGSQASAGFIVKFSNDSSAASSYCAGFLARTPTKLGRIGNDLIATGGQSLIRLDSNLVIKKIKQIPTNYYAWKCVNDYVIGYGNLKVIKLDTAFNLLAARDFSLSAPAGYYFTDMTTSAQNIYTMGRKNGSTTMFLAATDHSLFTICSAALTETVGASITAGNTLSLSKAAFGTFSVVPVSSFSANITNTLSCLSTVGINEVENKEQPLLKYDNGIYKVSSKQIIGTITVFDINGRKIREENCNCLDYEIDPKNLSQGLYILKISSASGEKTFKIIN